MKRRDFLRIGAMSGAALLLRPYRAWPFLQSPTGISKFTMPLPGLGPTGIPVATADTTTFPGNDYYRMVAGQFKQVFHPDFYTIYGGNFPGTTLWGYADDVPNPNHRYLGGVILANKGRPVRLQMRNNLVDNLGNPLSHPVPVDPTVMDPLVISGPEKALENRIGVHLHGGFVPWISDGGPFAWFGTPDPISGTAPQGPSLINVPDMPAPPPGAMTFYYPNQQTNRLEWYHDHAYGLTRLNAYVGLASAYKIIDQAELNLMNAGYIPNLSRFVPLVVQDKSFIPPTGNPEVGGRGAPGDLWYPSVYESNQLRAATGRWDLGDVPPGSGTFVEPTPPSAIPEFFADISVINGACYPFLSVEQRRYRFNFLNGSQARFFNLQLYVSAPASAPTNNNSGTEIPLVLDSIYGAWQVPDLTKVAAGPKMIQIGNEGGFLPFPVELNNPPAPFTGQVTAIGDVIPSTMTYTLLLGPAERADVIIDFAAIPDGTKLILYNDAPGPFPSGDIRTDYYTGAPDQTAAGGAPTPLAGFGPNTRTLMQFRVIPRVGAADPLQMALIERTALKGLGAPAPSRGSILPVIPSLNPAGQPIRRLGLYEDFDPYGRLRQLLGTLAGPTEYTLTAGEVVTAGTTEVWEIYNTTADVHPMHFHLVDVQVLGRAQFVPDGFGMPTFTNNDPVNGQPLLQTPFRGPDNNERGYKETVRMNPGEMTRVIMKFDLPTVPFPVPASPRTGGNEYVWHCHILEHEEHDMMHPLVVL